MTTKATTLRVNSDLLQKQKEELFKHVITVIREDTGTLPDYLSALLSPLTSPEPAGLHADIHLHLSDQPKNTHSLLIHADADGLTINEHQTMESAKGHPYVKHVQLNSKDISWDDLLAWLKSRDSLPPQPQAVEQSSASVSYSH